MAVSHGVNGLVDASGMQGSGAAVVCTPAHPAFKEGGGQGDELTGGLCVTPSVLSTSSVPPSNL